MLLSQLSPRMAVLARLVGLALIGWTVTEARHGLGGSGQGLTASVSFAVAAAAWIVWTVRGKNDGPRVDDGLARLELYPIAIAGGVLTAAVESSAASAFVFVAVVSAGVRAPVRSAAWVVVASVLALGVSSLVFDDSALGTLAYTLGFLAALLAGANARGAALRAEQAELLLAQAQRSHEEQLRATRLEESARIAREIHDVLAHTLAGLTIQLEATASLVEQGADGELVLARVRRAHELAREGLLETRRAVGALRGDPQQEFAAPLAEALEALVAGFRESSAAPVELTVDGDPSRLPGAAAAAVIRVTQEALTNARKHAPGAAVSIGLHAGRGEEPVLLVIADRWQEGVRPSRSALSASGGGFGLRGMRERAAELGGALVAGEVQDGWRVELRLPAPVGAAPSMERVG